MRPISYESTRRGFTRSHHRGRFRLLKPLIIVLVAALVGLIGFFITRFDIQTVEVRGAQFVDPEYVRSEVFQEIKKYSPMFGGNLIFFKKKGIEESLKNSIAVESLSFDRKFPHTLVVVLHEYRPTAFWATSGFTQEPIEEA
ncbi:MAG TPA: FtsQ-type POTRA domain-containing protein, partial [Patescibacteria group bacterium]|nr:FtsQ-type POTRA domain-containing protein [Patescibacteria group bacterium]